MKPHDVKSRQFVVAEISDGEYGVFCRNTICNVSRVVIVGRRLIFYDLGSVKEVGEIRCPVWVEEEPSVLDNQLSHHVPRKVDFHVGALSAFRNRSLMLIAEGDFSVRDRKWRWGRLVMDRNSELAIVEIHTPEDKDVTAFDCVTIPPRTPGQRAEGYHALAH